MNEFWDRLLHEFQTPFTNSVLIFSVILFIILLVPIFFNRFKIPGIIGLILSGTIIGPHGLNLIQRNSAVDLFSTIGLLYIMFTAGLELDLGEFKKHRTKSIVFGILTFIIPISIGFLVFYYLIGYPVWASTLIASMLATHTLIAYPIVTRLGISKNQAVAVAVGGTILTDTAVLIILAIISGAVQGGLSHRLWTTLGISISIFALIVIFVVPRVSSWFFRRLEDEKSAHFIYILSAVFFCAFLAELAGLEPIIGAFAAGLTLNRLIPHTSSLMNRIQFVGNSLFIPFFLISVGMIVNLRILTTSPEAIIVALTLAGISIVAKGSAAKITGLLFKYSKPESNLLYGLSGSHAAATLAVILVGYNIELVDESVLNGTVILILISCVVASFVAERAGKKIVIESDTEEHADRTGSGQRILVPISNPTTMERLIDFAITLKEPKNPFPIVALTVVQDDDKAQAKLLQAKKMLEKAIVHAAAADQKIEITATIDQNVTNGIKRVTREMFITDLVMGWPAKTKLAEIIFGKTFDNIVNQTSQNLYITRFTLPLNVHRHINILCPPFVEKEEGFYKWLGNVFRMASRLNLRLTVFSTTQTFRLIEHFTQQNKISISVSFTEANDIGNLSHTIGKVYPDDIYILISSRKDSISYTPYLDILPRKMIKYLSENSLIFIYPETIKEDPISVYTETDGGLLEKSIDLLKGVKDIFTKGDK